LILCNTF